MSLGETEEEPRCSGRHAVTRFPCADEEGLSNARREHLEVFLVGEVEPGWSWTRRTGIPEEHANEEHRVLLVDDARDPLPRGDVRRIAHPAVRAPPSGSLRRLVGMIKGHCADDSREGDDTRLARGKLPDRRHTSAPARKARWLREAGGEDVRVRRNGLRGKGSSRRSRCSRADAVKSTNPSASFIPAEVLTPRGLGSQAVRIRSACSEGETTVRRHGRRHCARRRRPLRWR